jgi:hypothetical protein
MSPVSAGRRVLGALGLVLPALAAAAGAAARPGGAWLGVPGWGLGLAAAAAVGWLAWRTRDALAPASGLLVPLAVFLAGASFAGPRALSGPALMVLTLAGLALVAPRAGWRVPGGRAFLPLAFAALAVFAGRTHAQVGPRGDEPHYLMVAESLLRDADLSLEDDYARGRYRVFHDAPLEPHYRVRGRDGEIFSLHAVGLSVLVLPAWAAAGYAGVSVWLAFVAALVAREVREWVRELTGREALADAAGWAAVLSAPLAHYAGLVFTEVPAALALSFGLRAGRRNASWAVASAGACAAVLPWLNVRYTPLAVVVVAHALWRSPRRAPWLLAPGVVSAAGLLLYHQALYGFWDPRRVYGRRPELALSTLGEGLPGLLLDQEFGLLAYAPALVLAVPGFAVLARRDRRLALAAGLAVAAVVLTAGTWHMWRGGFNPPGRFLVPIAPLLAVAAALVVDRRGLTAGSALLLGWTLACGMAGAAEPRLVHRDRDGTAPLFRELSGAREWTGLLPAYVLADPDRHRLAALWAAALAAALPWRAAGATAGRVAVAGVALVVAAQAAAALSHARTDDRDAVRLLGRPAVSLPLPGATASVGAVWSPSALGWGPLYEPHRHPAGVAIGRRLLLPAGAVRGRLSAEVLDGGVRVPFVSVAPDQPGAPRRRFPCRPTSDGWEVDLAVRRSDGAVSLTLEGGGPMLVRAIELAVQPPVPASGPSP